MYICVYIYSCTRMIRNYGASGCEYLVSTTEYPVSTTEYPVSLTWMIRNHGASGWLSCSSLQQPTAVHARAPQSR